jgi:Uma2 family endonuclease
MDKTAKPERMTANEFLAWAEEQDGGRYELIGGQVVAMAPERAQHADIKRRVANAFEEAIRAKGCNCQSFVDGLGVRIDDRTLFEPDALVNCGPRVPGDSLIAPNPVIVVEVISPHSRRQDLGAKFLDYFRHPAIEHYLVLLAARSSILHHRRGETGLIVTRIVNRSERLLLDPPGLDLAASDLFGADYSSSSS